MVFIFHRVENNLSKRSDDLSAFVAHGYILFTIWLILKFPIDKTLGKGGDSCASDGICVSLSKTDTKVDDLNEE